LQIVENDGQVSARRFRFAPVRLRPLCGRHYYEMQPKIKFCKKSYKMDKSCLACFSEKSKLIRDFKITDILNWWMESEHGQFWESVKEL